MGWGTFIAGRLLRTPKAQESNFEEFAGAYIWLGEKFITSYKNRVVLRTVLIHPKIIDKTDNSEWEILLNEVKEQAPEILELKMKIEGFANIPNKKN